MNSDEQEYEEVLKLFLSQHGEIALERAYELGRRMINSGGGLADMASIHSNVLARLLPELERAMTCETATLQASVVFVEGLSPFEMALRGFREANEELQRLADDTQQRYQDLVEGLPGIVYSIRLSEPPKLVFMSPQAERVLGVPMAEIDLAKWLDLVHPDDRDALLGEFRALKNDVDWQFEHRVVTRHGRTLWLRSNGRSRINPATGERMLQGVATDVTEQRETESQLRQAQKIESIGALAGGVAHDFNNILSVILSSASLAKEEVPEALAMVHSDLEEVVRAAYRGSALTRQLLTFARQSTTAPKVLDPGATLEDTAKMLQRLLGENVTLVTSRDTTPWNVRIDPVHFEQILLNLAVNARDAMPKGGRVHITIGKHMQRKSEWVTVSVTDTGTGMTPEVKSRIFEPFFTTKPQGKGTGLGLATVFGIVKQAGGSVEVDTEIGRGTTFRVLLPHAHAPTEEDVQLLGTARKFAGSETILFAEDDPSLRSSLARILSKNGYRVIEAPNGAAALKLLDAPDLAIDLLLTDLIMPQMGGHELIEKTRLLLRPVPVIVMSGYMDGAVLETVPKDATLMQKPFTPDQLLRRVREVLDQAKIATPSVLR